MGFGITDAKLCPSLCYNNTFPTQLKRAIGLLFDAIDLSPFLKSDKTFAIFQHDGYFKTLRERPFNLKRGWGGLCFFF
jgi:hypothetical protein